MAIQVNRRYRYNSGVVTLTMYATEEKLLGIELDHSDKLNLDGVFLTQSNKVLENAISQFDEFFERARTDIDLALDDYASDFEQKVYKEVKKIKFGETIELKDLAKKLKSDEDKVVEAICNNRFPIIVPTHRVVIDDDVINTCHREEANKDLLDFEQK